MMLSIIDNPIESSRLTKLSADELKDEKKRFKSLEIMSKEETIKLRQQHIGQSVTLFFSSDPLKMVQGKGQYLYDEQGNEYLDCINNVAHVGHANPHVQEAISRQLSLLNTNVRFLHDNLSLLAKRLTSTFPKHLSVCYLLNSGSEANDLAIRLARAHTGRKDIVCVDQAYHGNLVSTMAISPYKSHDGHHKGPKWAHVAPLPCSYRGVHAGKPEAGQLYAQEVEQLIEQAKGRGRQVAAFIVESMVSCGGQTPLPAGYLANLQRYLRREGALLICDEVQTGFGRCGQHMWAFQLQGAEVQPDIVTMGKPMGNGFPVSAVVTTPEVAASFHATGVEFFNTFGGNPASCSAALAVLDEIERLDLMAHAHQLGEFMLEELAKLQEKSSIVGDVRGVGLFIGIEIVEDRESKRPAADLAKLLVRRFRDERILMSTEGKFCNVLKFKPPMVFTMDDCRRFLDVLAKALVEIEIQIAVRAETRTPNQKISISSSSSVSSSSWLESSEED